MARRLAVLALFMFVVSAPAALADGPMPAAVQGGFGVLAPNGKTRYVAVGIGKSTAIETVSLKDGSIWGWATLAGSWGIPAVTFDANGGDGLSRDGKTLVLATTGIGPRTKIALLDTRSMLIRDRFTLEGSFAYDALSPDASKLYLIQWVDSTNLNRYVVREYDLRSHRLLPGSIADRTQKSWVMQGSPMTRTTSANGRWVFTLYQNIGGYPFIHALDTVNGVAHCIGVPFTGDQSVLANVVLAAGPGGRTLAVHWRSGRPWLAVDTATWRITQERAAGGFPWRWLWGGAGGAAVLLAAAGLLLLQRRHAAGPVSAQAV